MVFLQVLGHTVHAISLLSYSACYSSPLARMFGQIATVNKFS